MRKPNNPKHLLLRRGEKERGLDRQVRIKRILVGALHEGVEGKDVGSFPDSLVVFCLERVEVGHQGLGKAPVRRDDGDAGGVAFGEAGEEIRLGEHKGVRAIYRK